MIRHVWSLLSRDAAVDAETNSLILFRIIESLRLPAAPPPPGNTENEIPWYFMPYTLVTLWEREPREQPIHGQARVLIIGPDGEEHAETEVPIDLGDDVRCRTFCRFPGIPAAAAGTYRFQVEFKLEGQENWQNASTVALDVEIGPEVGGRMVHLNQVAG